ncbi:MAG: 4'-phosphopantetheinyl transferase superfamily protein [Bacteroidota bacterium]
MINIRKIDLSVSIGILDLKVFSETRLNLQKRALEKAGTHFLLTEMLKSKDFELGYSSESKPYLIGKSEHISISHSHDKLAIIINTKETTGIDIELIRNKVVNIQHKFLSEKELLFAKDNVEKLITIWAAKEAIYKVYGIKELDFIANLFVEDFDGSVIIGKIDKGSFKKQYKLISENVSDYKLVYVLNEL